MAFDPAARPRVVPGLARFAMSVFFRRIEVLGAGHLPRDRPLVLVANHANGLIDPALLIGFLPVCPRFLAKSTLWRQPFVRPFLDLAAAIPVYRRQDTGVDVSRNEEMFDSCHRVLAAGGALAIFPEGRSHTEPSMMTLRTGVSRIVLGALDRWPELPLRIVPVGLTFDDKDTFRSRVLLDVGLPIDPRAWLEAWREDPREAARDLTGKIRTSLEEVTLNFPSWEEARLIRRAAELYARPDLELPSVPTLAESVEIQQLFVDGYLELRREDPERVEAVARAVRDYDTELERLGVRDEQVASRYPWEGVARFVAKSLWRLLVRAPVGALGLVIHWPAWRTVRAIAGRASVTSDVVSTYKLFGSLVFYPLTWVLLSVVAGLLAGGWAALAALVAGPVTARVALAFHERRLHVERQARAFLLLRSRPELIDDLRERRRRVHRQVAELVERWQATRGVRPNAEGPGNGGTTEGRPLGPGER